ncbi:MAG: nucleoside-diphosphate kinase [Candidatus Aenigmarchaeota archaeon]|nr:nucleoside-diphosphate kinase [Candidatus Aenigmarchaeota archaeon]
MERTFVMVKPDGMRGRLAGDIIKRYHEADLKIVGMKVVFPDTELAEKHYTTCDEQIVGMGMKTLESAKENNSTEDMYKIFNTDNPKEIGFMLRKWLIEYVTSHPVIAMVLEGEDAVKKVRKLTGHTMPIKAEKGTIRGDFGCDSPEKANAERRAVENLVHASGSIDEAQREINLWFRPNELISYDGAKE